MGRSAAAIVVRAEDAERFTPKPLYIKALSFVAGNGSGLTDPTYDYTSFPEVVETARDAYAQAGVTDPRNQLAMAEVHDCFTPTELVLMEDLGFCERGTAWKQILSGRFDRDGELPVTLQQLLEIIDLADDVHRSYVIGVTVVRGVGLDALLELSRHS